MARSKKQKYNIYKSNELITRIRYQMTLLQQNLFNYIFTLIPDPVVRNNGVEVIGRLSLEERTIRFNINDFAEIMGYAKGGKQRQIIKEALFELDKEGRCWIETEDGAGERIFRIFDDIVIYKGGKKNGDVEIVLSPATDKHIHRLKRDYTVMNFLETKNFKSKYTFIIYELLKREQYRGTFTITFDELRSRMITDSSSYCEEYWKFNQKILRPSIEEINLYTTLSVNYALDRSDYKISFNISEEKSVPNGVANEEN